MKVQDITLSIFTSAARYLGLLSMVNLLWGQAFGAGQNQVSVSSALSAEQQGWLGRAYRHEKQGWVFLHLQGGARERGFQHGYLLAKEIAENLRVTRALWRHESAMDWSWLLQKTAPFLEPKIDAENLAEIDGMVEGLKAARVSSSRAEMLVYNAWLELEGYWWPKQKKQMTGMDTPHPPKQSCSAFIATGSMTADGGVVLGHNTMSDYPEATANVILDLLPAKGHGILMQTVPGWIHSGTDFFITDAGLVGAETTIGNFNGFDELGIPEFARMRRATQDAGSIDQWCETMKRGNNGGYANAWLLGDARSGEIARLELGLKQVRLEKKLSGYFIGSNIAEDLKLLRFETDANENDIRISNVARRVRWKKLMAQNAGKIDLKLARQLEADHLDSYFEREYPGARSICGHYELDDKFWGGWPGAPFYPAGTFDAKVVNSKMANEMSFAARWGSACGRSFDAAKFLAAHPQFDWMKDILRSRPTQPWTTFQAGEEE